MRISSFPAAPVVALLVLAGCAGLPSAGGDARTPTVSHAEFPNGSAIGPSVFDAHATAMGNTSFTLTVEKTRRDRNPPSTEDEFKYLNDTSRFLAEPAASQYLVHTTGAVTGNGSTYSDGRTEYVLSRENNRTKVWTLSPESVLNESSDRYLWRGVFDDDSGPGFDLLAIDATYQREGVETFQGVPVMRYEATGVDALPDRWPESENGSWSYERFSATLLLDADGVVRYYEYTFVKPPERSVRQLFSRAYTLSDVGSTEVEKPDWAANATAGP